VGVGAFYRPREGQEIIFQVLNNTHGEYNQQTLLYGGQWQGSFQQGLLQPMLSFHVDPRTKQKIGGREPRKDNIALTEDWKKTEDLYFAASNLTAVGSYKFEVDYLRNKLQKYNSTTKDSIDKSYVAMIRYGLEKVRPQVKYAYSEMGSTVDYRHNYHAALEYYPDPKADFRYHAGYSTTHIRPAAGNTRVTTKDRTWLVGLAGAF